MLFCRFFQLAGVRRHLCNQFNNKSSQISSFCTTTEPLTTPPHRSGNHIKLIGRVKNDMLRLENGYESFVLRTAKSNPFQVQPYFVHHSIKMKRGRTLTRVQELIDNDLVYVTGEILYEPVKTNDGKYVSRAHIFAKKVVHMNNSTDSHNLQGLTDESVNEVRLFGMIGTDLDVKNLTDDSNETLKYLNFSVVTEFKMGSVFNSDFSGDWHKVVVLDKSLMQYVEKSLKRADRVIVYGEISYKSVPVTAGRSVSRAQIIAQRIQKLHKFPTLDESDQDATEQIVKQ